MWCFFILFIFTRVFAIAAGSAAAGAMRTAYAALATLLGSYNICKSTADYQCYYRNNNYIDRLHTDTLSLFLASFASSSALSSLFLLIISITNTEAKAATIAQPRIGIHTAPRPTDEKIAPKK